MRQLLGPALLLSSALSACAEPAPVELPEDLIAAASTCVAAQTLVVGADKSAGDPITFDEFVLIAAYPMAASGQADPFDPNLFSEIIAGAEAIKDEISDMDYAGAIPACETRFAIDDVVELPEGNAEALFSCFSLSGFMQGVARAEGSDMAAQRGDIDLLAERLNMRLQGDPEALALLLDGDGEQLINAGLQRAFAEGAPDAYLDACAARFPAGG